MDDRVLLAEGREAEVFLLPDGNVLKLMRQPGDGERVESEAAVCRLLRGHGHLAPEILEEVTVDGRPGLVMERIDGAALLAELERRPLMVLAAGRALAEAHAALHECAAPPELPDVRDRLRLRIAAAEALPPHLREMALRVLDGLPGGDRICHGDYHLGNILGPWSSPVIIDWGYASAGDPTGDVARTVLLHRVGAMPPGTSPGFGMLARVGRRVLTRRYLAVYRSLRPFDGDLLSRWLVVHAAARVGEPIPEERPALTRLLERHASTSG